MKIKIGQKVKVKKDISDHSDFWSDCSSCNAEYLIITDITNITNSNYYWWDAYDKDNKEISYCCGHNLTENDFIPYERTIDDVKEGDLISDGTYFRRVLGRAGQMIAFSSCWEKGQEEDTDFDYWQKISHFKERNYTLVTETLKTQVTKSEIAEKFNTKVEDLEIID